MRGPLPLMIATWIAVFLFTAMTQSAEPIDIGSRRELFVDHHLIGSLSGVRLALHRPELAARSLRALSFYPSARKRRRTP